MGNPASATVYLLQQQERRKREREKMTQETPMNPNDIHISLPPLVGTMGSAQIEHAAALVVRACQKLDNKWQPITSAATSATIKQDLEGKVEPFFALFNNPFFTPNIVALAESKFAEWTEEPHGPIQFTQAGLDAMKKWVLDEG